MYIQEISIEIKSTVESDEAIDAFNLLMSFYQSSGQTQGKIESQYFAGNQIVSLPYSLEKDALNPENNNHYVDKQREIIEELCKSKFQFKTIGTTYECWDGVCRCEKPDFYILITNFLTITSPITCGTCNYYVPLYRLPIYEDYGYRPILSWVTNYVSCDSLQMNCEVGERWALRQMQDVKSQLTKQGREICQKIEDLSKIPTFYYLHNYRKPKKDNMFRLCPSCSNKWHLEEQLHSFYDFKCDVCKLISTKTMNS